MPTSREDGVALRKRVNSTMGILRGVICRACGQKSTVSEGGGFVFHLLRCDLCGDAKSISFEEIGEPHLRYLKGNRGRQSLTAPRWGGLFLAKAASPLSLVRFRPRSAGRMQTHRCQLPLLDAT